MLFRSKVKRQPSEWEKIIANEATDKQLISKIYKQLLQLNCRCVFDVLWGRQFNRLKSSYFSIFAFVAYAFGVTYIKSLLRSMFTTSPGCFLLVDV